MFYAACVREGKRSVDNGKAAPMRKTRKQLERENFALRIENALLQDRLACLVYRHHDALTELWDLKYPARDTVEDAPTPDAPPLQLKMRFH